MRQVYALLGSLCLSPALIFSLENNQSSDSDCGCGPHPQRLEVKHIEGKGIGYDKGYSTLEGFFTIPSTLENNWVPFLDVRAHVFNDGRPAVNAGLGLRYLGSRVWGANVYYDYRKTSRFHYNQVGAGLETLGKIWDFRINGYFPVGKKESNRFHYKFHKFQGHNILLKNRIEFAMTGGNAEVGAHAYNSKNIDLYAAAGPYYFAGEGRRAWGGEGRLVLTAVDHLRFQVSGSYDTIFKGIVQGEVGIFFTFGGRRAVKKRECLDCCDSRMIVDRALQRVDRQEIIVVDRKKQTSKAINPVTGNPYTVWFVNNLSHGLGTFESPFNTLLAAQNASGLNDIIYVYPGDGIDTGMDRGIVLKRGQQLLGAGIDQTLITTKGTFIIPAQASGLPFISNFFDPTGLGVQLVDGNNIVSGFNLQDRSGGSTGGLIDSALSILGGSNYLIKQNTISTLLEGDGITIFGGGANTAIINNTFLALDDGSGFDFGVFIDHAPGFPFISGPMTIRDNLFTGANSLSSFAEGIVCSLSASSINQDFAIDISNNTLNLVASNPDPTGISLSNRTNFNFAANINNNQIFVKNTSGSTGVEVFERNTATKPLVVNVTNNVVQPSPPAIGYVFNNQSGDPSKLQVNFDSNVGTRQNLP